MATKFRYIIWKPFTEYKSIIMMIITIQSRKRITTMYIVYEKHIDDGVKTNLDA